MSSMAAQIFFAAVGAAGEVRAVVQTAPSLFIFCFLQIAVHLLLILGAGRMAGFSRKELLLASNANVGGRTPSVDSDEMIQPCMYCCLVLRDLKLTFCSESIARSGFRGTHV